MKKRNLRLAVLIAAALSLLLCACGSKSLSASEARSGVARVLTFYDMELYDPSDGSYVGTVTDWAAVGSAFGVGTAGEETDVFITNRHVVQAEAELLSIEGDVYIAVYNNPTAVYLLLDNYAYNRSTGTLDPSRAMPCTVIYTGASEAEDLAVLRTAEAMPGRIALALQDSEDSLEVGDAVTALGYPMLSDNVTSEGYLLATVDDVTVTSGTVARFFDSVSVTSDSSLGRVIQSTAAINGGNSGGPLVDGNGAVVGINTFISNVGDASTTTAYYALRVQYAKAALDSLNISYDVYRSGGVSGVVVAVAVVVVAAAAAAVVLLTRKGRASRPAAAGGTEAPARPTAQPAMAADSGLRFQCEAGVFSGKRFSINGQVRIGRDPSRNDLVFPEHTQGISGVHCVLACQDGRLYLKDLGSTYGTFLGNGQRLASGQTAELQVGDRFWLGSERERFVITRKGGA